MKRSLYGVATGAGVGVGGAVAGGGGGGGVGVGGGVGGIYRTTTTCLSGTHWTYAPMPSEITRTGTSTWPWYMMGGTSSGRDSPLMTTSGLPTVTFTSAPGLLTSTVLLAASYDTVAPICSNIERSGMSTVPPRTSAASTRPRLRQSGFAST